jgi:hypothetical protein
MPTDWTARARECLRYVDMGIQGDRGRDIDFASTFDAIAALAAEADMDGYHRGFDDGRKVGRVEGHAAGVAETLAEVQRQADELATRIRAARE